MSFVNQSQSVVMQNQSKHEIAFDTQLKTAPICNLLDVSVSFVLKHAAERITIKLQGDKLT